MDNVHASHVCVSTQVNELILLFQAKAIKPNVCIFVFISWAILRGACKMVEIRQSNVGLLQEFLKIE